MARTTARLRAPRRLRGPALRIVWTTVPPRHAARVARALVEARAAACVQVVPGVRSVYRWKGEVRRDAEALLIIKATRGSLPRCLALLKALHPYDVPELVVLPPGQVSGAYDRWAQGETRPDGLNSRR